VRGRAWRQPGDALTLAALALAVLVAIVSTSRIGPGDAAAAFRWVLATQALSDDSMILADQLGNLGRP